MRCVAGRSASGTMLFHWQSWSPANPCIAPIEASAGSVRWQASLSCACQNSAVKRRGGSGGHMISDVRGAKMLLTMAWARSLRKGPRTKAGCVNCGSWISKRQMGESQIVLGVPGGQDGRGSMHEVHSLVKIRLQLLGEWDIDVRLSIVHVIIFLRHTYNRDVRSTGLQTRVPFSLDAAWLNESSLSGRSPLCQLHKERSNQILI